jgi:NarL family two-component system response regulator LiaR
MSEYQNPMQSYRILIVDDIPTVREGLRWLFENEPEFTIIGEAGDGREAVRQATELAPDLVILDIELPLLDGFEVTQSLKTLPRPPSVVLLSIHCDPDSQRRGAEAGCDGFVEKSVGWPQLLATVRQVLTESGPVL